MQKIKNKKFLLILVVSIFFILVMLAQFIILAVLNNKTSQTQQTLDAVTKQNEEVKSDIDYLDSIDAKKEYARQNFGYVEPDEQLFKGEQ